MKNEAPQPVSGTPEARYVAEIRHHLGDVPHRQRSELVDLVATDLAERPSTSSWDQLVGELGGPVAYSMALRDEHGLPPRVGVGAHLRAARWTTWLIVVVVVVMVAGGVGYARWATTGPGLENNCSGAPPSGPGNTDPRVKVEFDESGGTATTISYVDAAKVSLYLCISAKPGVEIISVRVPDPSLSMFKQTSVHVADAAIDTDKVDPALDGPVPVPRAGLRTTIFGHLTNCEYYEPGGGMGFSEAEVKYHYRGLTRSAKVDLGGGGYRFVLQSRQDCPRARPSN